MQVHGLHQPLLLSLISAHASAGDTFNSNNDFVSQEWPFWVPYENCNNKISFGI